MGRWRAMWLVAAAAAIAVGPPFAPAQVRGQVNIGSPGTLRDVGSSGVVATFRNTSYGLGALQSPVGAPSSNLLRSAMESRASYTISRPGGDSFLGQPSVSLTPLPGSGMRLSRPMLAGSPGLYAGGSGEDPLASDSRLLKATSTYLNALGGNQDVGIATRLSPIISLVTGGDDQFSTYMEEGEKAFRAGDYDNAMERFKMANTVNPKNPDCLLSLAHASFAISRNSYYRAAYYLTRALKFMPDMPLLPIQPQAFYASPEQYTQRIDWLDKHLQSNPFDNDAFFVAAYFRWFQQDFEGARLALEKARRGKINPDLREAVNTFWDGMKASGKLSGTAEGSGASEPPAGPSSQPTLTPPLLPMESPTTAPAASAR